MWYDLTDRLPKVSGNYMIHGKTRQASGTVVGLKAPMRYDAVLDEWYDLDGNEAEKVGKRVERWNTNGGPLQ